MVWETTSGGVMTAATKKIRTIMTPRALFIRAGLTMPIRDSTTTTSGISKTAPKIRKMVMQKLT